MTLSKTQNYTLAIEELAQRRTKCVKIFEEQAEILRTDPEGLRKAHERISNSEDMIKPGQRWVPEDEAERERNMRRFEEICQMHPTSFDEQVAVTCQWVICVFSSSFLASHMKISAAAHGILMYLVTFYIPQYPSKIQAQITRRSTELMCVFENYTVTVSRLIDMQPRVGCS
jgi:hypothetical protein